MKDLLDGFLALLDMKLVRLSSHQEMVSYIQRYRNYELIEYIDPKFQRELIENVPFSMSQLGQDLFVLSELCFKKGGFFVEFGASNGVDLSNTYLLETKFGWAGILAEPAKIWHQSLEDNRSAFIEKDCIWNVTGENLLFNEVRDKNHNGELSTIDSFSDKDIHKKSRKKGSSKYEVSTITLYDVLKKYNAPKTIDYLSIDTEGSEFEILKNFDFDEYNIKIITCEHNYTENRELIYEVLTGKGYERKLSEYSMFDDWYVKR